MEISSAVHFHIELYKLTGFIKLCCSESNVINYQGLKVLAWFYTEFDAILQFHILYYKLPGFV